MSEFFTNKKLLYWEHLARMLRGEPIIPITWELDLTLKCNQNCEGCVAGRRGAESFESQEAVDIVRQIRQLGGEGLILTGGGDPSLNPEGVKAVAGMLPTLFFTNGQELKEDFLRAVLPRLSGVRVSLDAFDAESAAKWRGITEDAWNKMLSNTALIVRLKEEMGLDELVVGTGYLTKDDRHHGIALFAEVSTRLGVDYAQCRPFLPPPDKLDMAIEWSINDFLSRFGMAKKVYPILNCSDQKYSLMKEGNVDPTYDRCYIGQFASVVGADAKMYFCCHTRYMPEFCLGDLRKQTLRQIMNSGRIQEIQENLDFSVCPKLCRGDAINRVIHEIVTNPVKHKEFL